MQGRWCKAEIMLAKKGLRKVGRKPGGHGPGDAIEKAPGGQLTRRGLLDIVCDV